MTKGENKEELQIDEKHHLRPYWHVDAKWIFGIIFALFLCTTIFTYALMKITEKDTAVDISAYAIATTFSANGLSDTTEINDIKDAINASEKGYIKPIEGLDIVIRLEDLEGKSPEQMRVDIFKQISAPLYEGSEGLANITENDEMYKNIEEGQGLLKIFTRDMYLSFRMQFMIMALLTIGVGAFAIFFSHGFGRLVTPAIISLIVAIPNMVFWGIVKLISSGVEEVKLPFVGEAPGNEKLTGSITEVVSMAIPKIADVFFKSYGYLIAASGVLLIIAILGKIVVKIRNK